MAHFAAAGGYWCCAGESGERGLGAEPAGVGPGDEDGCRGDRADTGLSEELGSERLCSACEFFLERACFAAQLTHPQRERAQRERHGRAFAVAPTGP